MNKRSAIAGGVAVAAVLLAGAAWYVTVPLKHQRWERWHERNMAAIKSVLDGQPARLDEDNPLDLRADIASLYRQALGLAQFKVAADRAFTKQSLQTVKLIAVTSKVLKSNNTVGLNAIRTQIKDVLAKQEDCVRQRNTTEKNLEDWQASLASAWDEKWPDNELSCGLEEKQERWRTEDSKLALATAYDLHYIVATETETLLVYDSKSLAAEIKDRPDPSLTPYARDKVASSKARIAFCNLLLKALSSTEPTFADEDQLAQWSKLTGPKIVRDKLIIRGESPN